MRKTKELARIGEELRVLARGYDGTSNPDALFRLPGDSSGPFEVIKGRKLILELYFRTQQALLEDSNYDWKGGKNVPDNRYVWGLVRSANIFEIPVSLYVDLYHEADVAITRQAGFEWRGPDEEPEAMSEVEGKAYVDEVKKAYDMPYPDPLPFDVCYLAIDQPVQLGIAQREVFHIPQGMDAWAYAFVLSSSGDAFTLSVGVAADGKRAGIHILQEAHKGRWVNPLTLAPWMFSWIIRWINEHQTVIEESTRVFSYRHDFKRHAKKNSVKMPIPAPYHTVYMRDLNVKDAFKEKEGPKFRREQQHQSDVRGHWCVRVQRGSLPLDRQLERKLRKDSDRKIFTTERPDAEVSFFLASRGVAAKKTDEWMAVLVYWRSDYVKGPDGAPFIPAIRKSVKRYPDPPKSLLPKEEKRDDA